MYLALSPAVEELRSPIVDADNLLHLFERRIRTDIIVERKREVLGGIGIVIADPRSTKHFPHDEGERVDVHSAIGFDGFVPLDGEVEHFRAHVAFRSNPTILLLVEPAVGLGVGDGQAEVGDDAGAVVLDEDVLGLDVSMRDRRLALKLKDI